MFVGAAVPLVALPTTVVAGAVYARSPTACQTSALTPPPVEIISMAITLPYARVCVLSEG